MRTKLFFIAALFVAEAGTAQIFITVSTHAGTTIAGLLDGPVATAQFNSPYDLCVDDATGAFYVADAQNHCIRKISGGNVTTLAGGGVAGDVDAQGTSARFYVPTGVYFQGGYVYVTDNGNHKIKRIDALGNVTTIAGTGSPGCANGPALSSTFFNPVGLSVDGAGVVYVADYANHCIRKIASGMVSTFAGGCGLPGDVLGPASSARFDRPSDVVLGPSGDLYVLDQLNDKVKVVTPGGMVQLVAGLGTTATIDGIGASASFPVPVSWMLISMGICS